MQIKTGISYNFEFQTTTIRSDLTDFYVDFNDNSYQLFDVTGKFKPSIPVLIIIFIYIFLLKK